MRIQNGLNITSASWQVLRKDRELLVFPLLSAVTATLIVASALRQVFLAGLYVYATTGNVSDGFTESLMRRALTTSF